MKLSWHPLTLDLRTTFRIAHGASNQRHNMLVILEHEGLTGLGEAAAVPYYGESPQSILQYLADLSVSDANPKEWHDPFMIGRYLQLLPSGSRAARTAIDVALHDLVGKILEQPVYRLLGLDPTITPETSYTIAIDTPEIMAERAVESDWPVLKIKLGSQDDLARVAAIRKATSARLRVDANAGWDRQQAAYLIPRLAQYDLEFVEQPLAANDVEGFRWLRTQKLGVPLFADESAMNTREIAALAGAVDGVVVKLMKSCGLRESLAAIHTARALDMQIMLSCMVESSLGVTAASHLAPLCDYADLDGPLLIRNDPFQGIKYDRAKLVLPDLPGIGIQPR